HPSPDPATNPPAPPHAPSRSPSKDRRHTKSSACSTRRNPPATPLPKIPSPRPQNKFHPKSVACPLHTPSPAPSPIAPRNNPPSAVPAPKPQSLPEATEHRKPPPTECVSSITDYGSSNRTSLQALARICHLQPLPEFVILTLSLSKGKDLLRASVEHTARDTPDT